MARRRPRCFEHASAQARRLARLVTLYSPLVRHWCRQAGMRASGHPGRIAGGIRGGLLEPGDFRPTGPARRSGPGCAAWRGTSSRSTSGVVASLPSAGARRGSGSSRSRAPSDDVELSESPDDLASLCQRALAWCGTNSRTGPWRALRVTVEGHVHRRGCCRDGDHVGRDPPGQVSCPSAAEGRDRGAYGLRLATCTAGARRCG